MVLAACGETEEAVTNEPSARPVKSVVIGQSLNTDIRRFPARIESSQRADVSFRVAGKVQDILVAEGERVKAGDLIAELDPTEFQLVVDDRRAQYDQAKADVERYAILLERGTTTKQIFEDRQANFKSMEAALRLAERNLQYTDLKAPFDGEIAKRFVERFEDVREKQPILSMRDVQSLEVKFDVPERIMIQIGLAESSPDYVEPEVNVSFATEPDRQFPVDFHESAAFADPDTQTFEITYSLNAPSDLLILPGMTATATVDFSSFAEEAKGHFIPVDAVTATNELNAKVWVVDPEASVLNAREIEVGEMRGNLIEVTSGLEDGERVVVAGVPFLVEGMLVTVLPDVEQAVERQDDVRIRRDADKKADETQSGTAEDKQ